MMLFLSPRAYVWKKNTDCAQTLVRMVEIKCVDEDMQPSALTFTCQTTCCILSLFDKLQQQHCCFATKIFIIYLLWWPYQK